jgi:hypothetical protein
MQGGKEQQWSQVLRFYLIAIVAICLVLARMAFPQMVFDYTSLMLFGIACAAVLLHRIIRDLPTLKRFKVMEAEFEFS